MDKFVTLDAVAAPLMMINIDTDMIIPQQFLKTIKRSGLGVHAFSNIRYDDAGAEREDFILNQGDYRQAEILIAGDNFGCGSSREHAPWALKDFGIKCIIAPSFADIFYGNCFKNGLLPIKLDQHVVDKIVESANNSGNNRLKIDLENQVIEDRGGNSYSFEIDPFRRHCLMNGLDDIGLTLQKQDKIQAFEQKPKNVQPWLFNSD